MRSHCTDNFGSVNAEEWSICLYSWLLTSPLKPPLLPHHLPTRRGGNVLCAINRAPFSWKGEWGGRRRVGDEVVEMYSFHFVIFSLILIFQKPFNNFKKRIKGIRRIIHISKTIFSTNKIYSSFCSCIHITYRISNIYSTSWCMIF